MPAKNHLVYRRNVIKCCACGAECTWIKSHEGKAQLTPVWFDHRKQDWFYTTTGNHSNFRQVHDCVKEAEARLEELKRDLERLGEGGVLPDRGELREAFLEKWSKGFLATLSQKAKDIAWDHELDRWTDEFSKASKRVRLAERITAQEALIQERKNKIATKESV